MNLYFIHIFVAYMQKGDIVTWYTSQLWTKEKHIIPFTYHMATNHHAIQPCWFVNKYPFIILFIVPCTFYDTISTVSLFLLGLAEVIIKDAKEKDNLSKIFTNSKIAVIQKLYNVYLTLTPFYINIFKPQIFLSINLLSIPTYSECSVYLLEFFWALPF